MDIQNFRDIVGSEKRASTYIAGICGIIGGVVCPGCGDDDINTIEGGKRKRCAGCGYRFTLYSGRWLNEAHIAASKWLWVIKLFEMELTTMRISEETGISYPTALKAVTAIRKSIASATPYGKALLSPDGTRSTIPVYFSAEQNSPEFTEQLPVNSIKILERLGQGYLICTDLGIRYERLVCGGINHFPVDFGRGRSRFRFYLAHSFGARRFIMERMHKYHGVKDSHLPLYILEMEYRLNNRGDNLFEKLVEGVCRFIPVRMPGAVSQESSYVLPEKEYR